MKPDKNFEKVKIIFSDFDGVFTDGTGLIDSDGKVSKRINYRDVLGLFLALEAGLKVVIITGEKAGAVDYLSEKFPQIITFQGIRYKLPVVQEFVEKNNLKPENVLYIGDDINDFKSLNYAGVKVTVPNGDDLVKNINGIIITEKSGGEGVFREVTDCLLYNKSQSSLLVGE